MLILHSSDAAQLNSFKWQCAINVSIPDGVVAPVVREAHNFSLLELMAPSWRQSVPAMGCRAQVQNSHQLAQPPKIECVRAFFPTSYQVGFSFWN